jgi:hypothetical protein
MRARTVIALSLLPLACPLGAENPSPLSAPRADPFRALAAIKTRDDIWERSFDSLYEQMRVSFRADPTLGPAERRCPGLIDAVAAAARPVMRTEHYRQRDLFRARLAQLFARGLTRAQAREAYAFYASPDGRYLLELGTDSSSQQAKIARAPERFDRAAFEDDLDRTHAAIERNINPAAEQRAEAALERSHWYRPYLRLHPRIQQLRFAISRDKSLVSPAERSAMNEAIRRAGTEHLASCGESRR